MYANIRFKAYLMKAGKMLSYLFTFSCLALRMPTTKARASTR